jgi:hypothetical protein
VRRFSPVSFAISDRLITPDSNSPRKRRSSTHRYACKTTVSRPPPPFTGRQQTAHDQLSVRPEVGTLHPYVTGHVHVYADSSRRPARLNTTDRLGADGQQSRQEITEPRAVQFSHHCDSAIGATGNITVVTVTKPIPATEALTTPAHGLPGLRPALNSRTAHGEEGRGGIGQFRRIVALATGTTDDGIERALVATGGEVKNAILVLLAGVDGTSAARLLEESDGRLRAALAAAAD